MNDSYRLEFTGIYWNLLEIIGTLERKGDSCKLKTDNHSNGQMRRLRIESTFPHVPGQGSKQ